MRPSIRGTVTGIGNGDGSYSGDSSALVGATVEEEPHLFVLGLWEHPGGGVAWKVDHDEVEATVHRAFSDFEVLEMSADPPYWSQQLARWVELYGEEAGRKIRYAEAFQVCEYGRQPSREELRQLFPFLPQK